MSENQNISISIDDLLNSSVDDLADMPEFAVFPAGAHRVSVSFSSKTVNKHPSVEMKMVARETVELANPNDDQPLAAGTEGTILFMLDNDLGQGKLKDILKVFAGVTGGATLSEIMANANGSEVVAVTKVRQNKEKTQSYTDVVKVFFE